MILSQQDSQIVVPDEIEINAALARTTHMAIGAHQDDLEIMAFDAIAACYQNDDNWFTGVVATDGRGSAREGAFATYTDEDMAQIRIQEQIEAAHLGQYSAVALLNFRSNTLKDGANNDPLRDIERLIEAARPHTLYTHNLADKHDTHVALALRVIDAVRKLPEPSRPQRLYGCEVWRDLDWLPDEHKVVLDCSDHPDLQADLINVFQSQIAGGKRYDKAVLGRRAAHATFREFHRTDDAQGVTYAMDMTPLIQDTALAPHRFVHEFLDAFASDVESRIQKMQ